MTREEEKRELKKIHDELIRFFEKSEEGTRRVLFSCLVQDLDMKNAGQWLSVWNDPETWE